MWSIKNIIPIIILFTCIIDAQYDNIEHPTSQFRPIELAKERETNNYISWYKYRDICDHFLDVNMFQNPQDIFSNPQTIDFKPENVKEGDVIFITKVGYFLDYFFEKIHPKIKSNYILVSTEELWPSIHKWIPNLNKKKGRKKIIAWFGKNEINHKKYHMIPNETPNNQEKIIDYICHKLHLQTIPKIHNFSPKSMFADNVNIKFNPDDVKNGDVILIFLYNEINGITSENFLDFFFEKIHSKIKSNYILITHRSICYNMKKYKKYLNDKKLIAWLGKNVMLNHPKTFPLPLGMPAVNANAEILEHIRQNLSVEKEILLYMNFVIGHLSTHRGKIRQKVEQFFSDKKFCYKAKNKEFKEYLLDMAKSKFVLSPEGVSIDCFRTWEAMLVGSIPIITSSIIDKMFDDLPVLIIDDWNDITEEFLNKKYQEITSKSYNLEKLFPEYWFNKINNLRDFHKTI